MQISHFVIDKKGEIDYLLRSGLLFLKGYRMHRNKAFWTLLLGCCSLLFGSNAAGQCPQITVSSTSAQYFMIGDIDFQHFPTNTLLFTVTMLSPDSVQVTLAVAVDVQFLDGSGSYQNAVTYKSHPFWIPKGGRTITNLNLGYNATDIKTDQFNFDDNVKQKLKDVYLGSGSFPAGIYTFHIRVAPTGVCPSDDKTVVFVIQNLTRIELRSPRDGETTNEFPLFEFSFDGNRSEIIVAELAPDQTPDDAIARKPAMTDQMLMGQNSYLYGGGRPLENGKTYAWRVLGKIQGPNGSSSDVPSEIRKFTVATTPVVGSVDEIIRQLEEIFGARYHDLFEQLKNDGYASDGAVTLNGQSVGSGELFNLLNLLREQSETAEVGVE
jgi:hypothetical protein